MALLKSFGIVGIFAMGLLAGIYGAGASGGQWDDTPLEQAIGTFQPVSPVPSPKDRIPERAIGVYRDRVVLDLQDAQWSTFTDTHSMEPVIVAGANAIQVVPESPDDIQVGDIVSYESRYADGIIIHRVVYKGTDEEGIYFIMKGDNLPTSDPGRVRFEQVRRVVVAIVY